MGTPPLHSVEVSTETGQLQYRQHQRLRDSGIELSRSTLIHRTSRAIDLLAPITAALTDRHARLLHMRRG